MKMGRMFLIFALVFSLAVFAFPTFGSAKVLIKLQQAYSANLPTLGEGVTWFAKELKEVSGGDVNVKIYEPGKLVAPFEILEAVGAGKVDAGVAGDGFFAGKVPAGQIFSSIPFGPEADEYMAWYYYGGGAKLHEEVYNEAGYNVKVMPVVILVPETAGWFSAPIESLDDLQGMKMRFYGLGGQIMQKLGMSVTLMPPAELFPALEKKVIDATEFSTPAIDQRLGFYKIVKYNYFPAWHQQATIITLFINKDKWNALNATQQKQIEITAKAAMLNAIAEGESAQGAVIKENVEKRGVHNMYWSDEFLAAFKKTWDEVAQEQMDKDPAFKKVFESLQAFRDDYKYWQTKGFLPRNCQQ